MSRQLPPLSYLRAFEATARLGSVTRAADELGRTHGAISKQLQLLQEQLGLPVFEKVGTGLRLNQDGTAFFATVSRAFDLLEDQWRELRASQEETGVRIACSATFAMVWLVPRLGDFYRLYPTCKVQLTMSSSFRDLTPEARNEEVDIMLSWDRLSRPVVDRHAVPLGNVSFCLASAPSYPFERDGTRLTFPVRITHDLMAQEWRHWQDLTGTQISWQSELHFPHTHLCVSAAMAGLGVALVEKRLAQTELQAGRLVQRSDFYRMENGFLAMTNTGRKLSASATQFMDWLRRAFEEEDSKMEAAQ